MKTHLSRIYPTLLYAKAQNNNHAITEGVALYITGQFLFENKKKQKYHFYHIKGLKLIEERVRKLILNDGTFSQYSVTYHRMVLDLLSIVELFRIQRRLKLFSKNSIQK